MESHPEGDYEYCPRCKKNQRVEVELGCANDFIFCAVCEQFLGSMSKKEKRLFLWHRYNEGCLLPEEESPYP